MDRIQALNHLKATIREATEQVTRGMLQLVWQGVEYQLDTCKVMKSAHLDT
jgi:hypothetical protein